jgi:hypothetical protein
MAGSFKTVAKNLNDDSTELSPSREAASFAATQELRDL